ncbi:tetratricopeptide repeat protein [Antarcticibacterium arcticum]|nr:tetratricopeptide repeat protein [Antarcticibacterium arcticum]
MLVVKAGAQTPALTFADSLYAVGNSAEAIKTLEEVSPKSPVVYSKLARYQSATGNLDAALTNYEILLNQEPGRVLTAMDYAATLIKKGRLESADSLYSLLSQSYPKNANFVFQQGVIRELQKDSSAIDYFKQVIHLDNTHREALYKLAKNELQRKQYNMAVFYSQMGLEHYPTNASLLSILAQTYMRQNRYHLAIPTFEEIIAQGQGNEFVHSRLGFAYYNEGFFEKAIENYKSALEFEDRNSDSHYNLGKLYALTGDLERSETHLLMAILIKKQPVDAEYLSLGLTYKLKKDHKRALEYLNKALEENPGNERALYEKAVAADNYFKDLQTKIDHYRAYLNKFEGKGNDDMIYLAKTRLSDLKKEQHLSK